MLAWLDKLSNHYRLLEKASCSEDAGHDGGATYEDALSPRPTSSVGSGYSWEVFCEQQALAS